jgi:hypothetical protein
LGRWKSHLLTARNRFGSLETRIFDPLHCFGLQPTRVFGFRNCFGLADMLFPPSEPVWVAANLPPPGITDPSHNITDLPGLPREIARAIQGYVAKAPFSHNDSAALQSRIEEAIPVFAILR